jgi:hypothetical protein
MPLPALQDKASLTAQSGVGPGALPPECGVLTLRGGAVAAITTFQDPRLFGGIGLPAEWPT